jgi:pyruvate kinase
MVTMPSEAATNYGLVRDLLNAGMDVMRINCAHDDSLAWQGMIENLRRAKQETGRRCRVLMDLADRSCAPGRSVTSVTLCTGSPTVMCTGT